MRKFDFKSVVNNLQLGLVQLGLFDTLSYPNTSDLICQVNMHAVYKTSKLKYSCTTNAECIEQA